MAAQSGQVAVAAGVPTLIFTTTQANQTVYINAMASTTVFLGPALVTLGTGFPIDLNRTVPITVAASGESIYALCGSTCTVSFFVG